MYVGRRSHGEPNLKTTPSVAEVRGLGSSDYFSLRFLISSSVYGIICKHIFETRQNIAFLGVRDKLILIKSKNKVLPFITF